VAIGDLNADGRPDLAVASGSGLSVLLGNGDGTFGSSTNLGTESTGSVVIADLNGDGRPDLAAASGTGISVLLGTGDGTFGPETTYGTGGNARSVAIADLNADGLPDLAVTNSGVPAGNGDTIHDQSLTVLLHTATQPTATPVSEFLGESALNFVAP